jgi:hypothetical protein
LEAEHLLALSVANVGLLSDVVADCALILFSFLVCFDEKLWPQCLHTYLLIKKSYKLSFIFELIISILPL